MAKFQFRVCTLSLETFSKSDRLQMEDMYKKAHAAIRKDPEQKSKPAKKVTKKRFTAKKLTHAERRAKVQKSKEEFMAQIEAQRD